MLQYPWPCWYQAGAEISATMHWRKAWKMLHALLQPRSKGQRSIYAFMQQEVLLRYIHCSCRIAPDALIYREATYRRNNIALQMFGPPMGPEIAPTLWSSGSSAESWYHPGQL